MNAPREIISLFDAMKELAATLHTATHSGEMKDCPDLNCQRFKDDEQ